MWSSMRDGVQPHAANAHARVAFDREQEQAMYLAQCRADSPDCADLATWSPKFDAIVEGYDPRISGVQRNRQRRIKMF